MKEHVSKWVRYAGTAGTAVIGAAAIFVLGSLLPIDGNYEFRVVLSGSMAPTIEAGSVIAIIPKSEYHVGDIVTFSGTDRNETPTTHRLVAADTSSGKKVFTTKGDANEDPDYRTIREDEIIGKVFLTIPYAGHLIAFTRTPFGFWLLIVLPLSALACLEIYSRFIRQKEPQSAKETAI